MKKVFIDTEFTGLHKDTTIISIGMKAPTGDRFYAEFTDYDKSQVNSWLQENIIDKLLFNDKGEFTSLKKDYGVNNYTCKGRKEEVVKAMYSWFKTVYNVDNGNVVEVWSDCLAYDWVLFCDLFGGALNLPKFIYYIPQDICTLFKAAGIDPDVNREEYAEYVSSTNKHNALHDAEVIEACYVKLATKLSLPVSFMGIDWASKELPDIKGAMIYLEGPDGSGKSTQAKMLVKYLESLGYKVIHIRQPGIPGLAGACLRKALFNEDDDCIEEFWAKRMVFTLEYRELIRRYGSFKDAVIICDRCAVISNVAIGGAEISNPQAVVDRLKPLYEDVRQPDTVIVYNMPSKVTRERLLQRLEAGGDMNYYDLQEDSFHDRSCLIYNNITKYNAMPAENIYGFRVDRMSVGDVHEKTIEILKSKYKIEKQ